MKLHIVVVLLVLVTATVTAERERGHKQNKLRFNRNPDAHMREEGPLHRRKRDTGEEPKKGLIKSIPPEVLRQLMFEGVSQVKAAQGDGNTNTPSEIVADYMTEKLVEKKHITESQSEEMRRELKVMMAKKDLDKNLDKLLTALEHQHQQQQQSGHHSHHQQAAGQHPNGGQMHHGNQQNTEHHPQGTHTAQQNSNRDHGNHEIPTHHGSSGHPQGQRPDHTMGLHQNQEHHSAGQHPDVASSQHGNVEHPGNGEHNGNGEHHENGEHHGNGEHETVQHHGNGEHNGNDQHHGNEVEHHIMTPEGVKKHVEHVIQNLQKMENETKANILLNELSLVFQEVTLQPDFHHDTHPNTHDPNAHVTAEEVKEHLDTLLEKVATSTDDSHAQTTLNHLYHVINSFEMHDRHMKPQHDGQHGGQMKPIEHPTLTIEYVRGYAVEVIDNLEAHHNAEEVQTALQELAHALHMMKKHHGTDLSDTSTASVHKTVKDALNKIEQHHDRSSAQSALNVISHFLHSLITTVPGYNETFAGMMHHDHQQGTFEENLKEIKRATTKVIDAVEAELEGQELEHANAQLIGFFSMIHMTHVEHHSTQNPDAPHNLKSMPINHVTPESVLEAANVLIANYVAQKTEEHLESALHEITALLQNIESKYPHHLPHYNNQQHHAENAQQHHGDPTQQHHGDPTQQHHADPTQQHHGDPTQQHHGDPTQQHHGGMSVATPESVKALAADVVDHFVKEYTGQELETILMRMTQMLENIKKSGFKHKSADPARMAEYKNLQNQHHNGEGEKHHEEFVNNHHKPVNGGQHHGQKAEHATPHHGQAHGEHPTQHGPQGHERQQQEDHFQATEHHRENIAKEHETTDQHNLHNSVPHAQEQSNHVAPADNTQSVLGLGTSLLPDLGFTGSSSGSSASGGYDEVPSGVGVSADMPSRTFSGSDDHFLTDNKSGHGVHGGNGAPPPHFKRK